MPTFANDLDHAVYVRDDQNVSVKLGAHPARTVSGSAADLLQELVDADTGVRLLEGAEAREVLAAQRADQIDPTVTAEGAVPAQIAAMHGMIGLLTVSAPLQVVVGDDAAPFGPPTGTTTTKQALATADPGGADRRQFAENEALITDEENDAGAATVPGSAPIGAGQIHESQRQAREAVEAAVAELGITDKDATSAVAGDGADDDDDDGDKYDAMSHPDLKTEAVERDLDFAGNASSNTLRDALRADDESNVPPTE